MPAARARVLNPTIKVNGSALRQAVYDSLFDLRVERAMQMPASFSLRLRDPDFALVDAGVFKIADEVEILLPTSASSEVSVMTGEITSIGVDQGAGDRHELVVSGLDAGHRLAHGSGPRTFLNLTALDIVSKVAAENGLSAKASGPAQAKTKLPYYLHVGSDYALLSALAQRAGCDWWVDGSELHFAPRADSSPLQLTFGEDLQRFKVRFAAAGQTDQVEVRGWDPAAQKAVVGKKAAPKPSAPDTVGTDAPFAAKLRKQMGSMRGYDTGHQTAVHAVESVAEAEGVALALAETIVAETVHARGEALSRPQIRPGGIVDVAGMGESLSGKYFVTEVEHVWGAARVLTTRFVVGSRRPAGLVDLLGPDGAASAQPPWGRAGLVVGVVTNNNDPDDLGRVKVRFPTLSDRDDSTWARIVSVGAGATRGIQFVPEIDDEVLVGFERGDHRFPFVLGGVWSAEHKPPMATSEVVKGGKVTKRVVESSTGQVEFGDGDKPAERHVLIALKDGKTKLRVGEDMIRVETGGNPIEIVAGQATVVISKQGDITVNAHGGLTLKANQKLSLEGAQVEIKGRTGVKVDGGPNLELKASGMGKLEAGGILSVKGSMVKLN
ncbi:MAG: VgrG-related protein [Acidimicrobiia bacterium]|nr:VgrG-related protein [Acidimicrobiia bacterium]